MEIFNDSKVWSNEKISIQEKRKTFYIICIVISFILMFIIPFFLLIGIGIIMWMITIKKQKELRAKLNKEEEIIKQGYDKIATGFFVNNTEHKVYISNVVYGFSQIIDCESNGLLINITIDDFKNPRIVFDCRHGKNLPPNSKGYLEMCNEVKNVISALKIIISKNNEKYIETGTITKVEHKYFTEENASIQIKRLADLHSDGILTDYEFEMKKKELLEKVK